MSGFADLPQPLSRAAAAVAAAARSDDLAPAVERAYEQTVHFLARVALGDYLRGSPTSAEVNRRLFDGLGRKSLGHWLGAFAETVAHLEQAGRLGLAELGAFRKAHAGRSSLVASAAEHRAAPQRMFALAGASGKADSLTEVHAFRNLQHSGLATSGQAETAARCLRGLWRELEGLARYPLCFCSGSARAWQFMGEQASPAGSIAEGLPEDRLALRIDNGWLDLSSFYAVDRQSLTVHQVEFTAQGWLDFCGVNLAVPFQRYRAESAGAFAFADRIAHHHRRADLILTGPRAEMGLILGEKSRTSGWCGWVLGHPGTGKTALWANAQQWLGRPDLLVWPYAAGFSPVARRSDAFRRWLAAQAWSTLNPTAAAVPPEKTAEAESLLDQLAAAAGGRALVVVDDAHLGADADGAEPLLEVLRQRPGGLCWLALARPDADVAPPAQDVFWLPADEPFTAAWLGEQGDALWDDFIGNDPLRQALAGLLVQAAADAAALHALARRLRELDEPLGTLYPRHTPDELRGFTPHVEGELQGMIALLTETREQGGKRFRLYHPGFEAVVRRRLGAELARYRWLVASSEPKENRP
jgi:hypothetical protein